MILFRKLTATDLLTWALGLCAVFLTLDTLRKELFPPGPEQPERLSGAAWDTLVSSGHRMGPTDAKVVIVEFGDFQCPECRQFYLRSLRPTLLASKDVALVFHHLPLPQHSFSYKAAKEAECAEEQHDFSTYYDLLYTHADSIRVKTFASFARDAGVPNLEKFSICMARDSSAGRIESDVAMARGLKATGTPTILVNGILLSVIPDSAHLGAIIRSELARLK